jgi:hypothetical protein
LESDETVDFSGCRNQRFEEKMLGFSNGSGGGGVGAEDLAQLQSTMRAIELACSYIQVFFFFASSFFIHIRINKWFAPFLVSWLIFLVS